MSLLILSASDVEAITSRFSPDDLTSLMAQVFYRLSRSTVDSAHSEIQQPQRIGLSLTNHIALFMPSSIASMGAAVKVVSVPTPAAPLAVKDRGLPASTVVLDGTSGTVRAVVNARHLTALRNAAGSLLATRLLLPPTASPRSLLAFGAGAQIAAHIALFLRYYPSIRSCVVVNRSRNARLTRLVMKLAAGYPEVTFTVGVLPSSGEGHEDVDLETVVHNADIIITATSATTPLFPSKYVKPGTHLCLIGSYKPEMHEVDTDLVKRAGKVVVDSRDACLHEAGELLSAGLGRSNLMELGQLLHLPDPDGAGWVAESERVNVVRAAGDVTIFKSVGVGIQDVAMASAVVSRAERDGIGSRIDDFDNE
ncbi:hypothetical protein IEO21_04753 [Rhodonia placenta]|uniref:NAD(P)-binding protein n=1 Tax=Rhodonia placenta TaxID=104341 RepID=A0A8H7U2Q6_9APHY|nr:hypothetical protein IEO21_04753 [Postia placenta]